MKSRRIIRPRRPRSNSTSGGGPHIAIATATTVAPVVVTALVVADSSSGTTGASNTVTNRIKQQQNQNKITEVVKFNVGGHLFHVSRSLLKLHPKTMIAKIASEGWQKDPKLVLSNERDGEIFRHVLSYLRDGRVDLPLNVSKKELLAELKYYGVEEVNENDLDDSLDMDSAPLLMAKMREVSESAAFASLIIEDWIKCNALRDTWTFQMKNITHVNNRVGRVYDCDWILSPESNTFIKFNALLNSVGLQTLKATKIGGQHFDTGSMYNITLMPVRKV